MADKKSSFSEYVRKNKVFQVVNPVCREAPQDITLQRAVDLMREYNSSYLVITEKRKVLGMFTETDIVRKIMGKRVNWKDPVSKYMTKDLIMLTMEDSVDTAMDVMGENYLYHIPLVDENKNISGVLTVRSLIRFLSEFYPTEVYNLPPKSDQVMETPEGG